MKVNRGQVAKRLVRPFEIVLNEPFGQPFVENRDIVGQVAEGDELICQGAVETFVRRIVFRRLHAGVVMRYPQDF